jgi:FixJ family two-component response regulator
MMTDQPRLLVVDDEEAICEGCSRIFSRQGFAVSKTSNARDGLTLAQTEQYSAVLLDIKMPEMSGLDFLSQLRERQIDVPVILMTGFPSMPNAISAVRLGASGYVTKPFTPEEITQAVHRFVPQTRVTVTGVADDAQAAPAADGVLDEPRLFWQEAWLQPAGNDLVRIGAVLADLADTSVAQVELPRIGEVVYQGLPMARVVLSDGRQRWLPAPMTGVVEHRNERLAGAPQLLADQPCGDGWIAELCATRAGEDVSQCTERQVLVVSNDVAGAQTRVVQLMSLGCTAHVAAVPAEEQWSEFMALLARHAAGLVMVDAASLGEAGPDLVARICTAAPDAKLVVLAGAGCDDEATYRAHKIFYYGVDLFADGELTDVLDSAFRGSAARLTAPVRSSRNNESVASITITNRLGKRVTLIAEPGLLYRNTGLGNEIRRLLYDGLFPIQTMPGIASVDPREVLNAAHTCDAVILLLARDTGRLPGALTRNSAAEFTALTDGKASKVTTLIVQPPQEAATVDQLDDRTLAQLARHVVHNMASAGA